MYFVIGFTTSLGIITGIFSILNNHKKSGVSLIALSVIFPILTVGFCIRKSHFVFGGTDFEFLVQTALVDKRLEPWIILGVFILLILTSSISMYHIIRDMKYKF